MNPVIRVHITTKAERYESLKRAHIEAGFQIDNENPVPINGWVSFDAVRSQPGASS
jgi:hypothetical protein